MWLQAWPRRTRHLYAQLIPNQDGPDAEPQIWITPPRHAVRTVDELADVVAAAIAPYEPVQRPGVLIKTWLTRPPLSSR
ncbi:hypothetical protein QFZ66_001778 [Streptomyces sp. B4I13]|uniref:hypothetical protein n=1 Tax=unclassified Streptomyces TaxID=2593676 RepID=UPI00278012A0|nr:hypothetical protein [Streptomyces sp. B4I13]MDQ0834515.1 hypothetical protein [Streptomyces achromogenes]MDQ0957900.1 hypothetical protein [Streptomyces sp. B4I13]